MTRKTWILGALAALSLAGCGGGSDYIPADLPNTVPASALSSPQSYTTFVSNLQTVDNTEGLSLEGVTPPVTDTEEPIKLS